MQSRLNRNTLFACVLSVGVATLIAGKSLALPQLFRAGTLIATASYLAVAIRYATQRSPYTMRILAALSCCAVGDVVGPSHYLAGVWAFLAAHGLLIAAALHGKTQPLDALVAAMVAVPLGAAFLSHLYPSIPGSERVSVFAYTITITLMVVLTSSARRVRPLLFAGGAVFFISDLFVAMWRYDEIFAFGFVCYPLYYAACFILALSATWTPPDTDTAEAA